MGDKNTIWAVSRIVIDTVERIGRYVEILAHQDTPEGIS